MPLIFAVVNILLRKFASKMISIAGIWLSFLCTVGIHVMVNSYNEFRRLRIYLEFIYMELNKKNAFVILLFSLVSVIISHIPVLYFFMSAPIVFLD